MTYNILETSNYDGEPVYLYEFRLNDTYWRYTSAAASVSLLGSIWAPTGIADDGVKQTGETQVDALNITLPTSNAVVGLFIGTPPVNSVFLTIRRFHYGDDDAAVCYVGEVYQVNQSSPSTSIITCNTISAALERNGLRLAWSRSCPYALYDSCCKVLKDSFVFTGVVGTVGTASITVNGADLYGDDYFTGGYIEWMDADRGTERRAIEDHKGNQLAIFGVVGGIEGGRAIKVYPGCARNTEACDTKFNNLKNYGGVPSMPGRSPFDGNPIF